MEAADTRGGGQFIFAEYSKKIERQLTSAQKDNDFIYHAKLPDRSTLASIAKAPLAKGLPLTPLLSRDFKGSRPPPTPSSGAYCSPRSSVETSKVADPHRTRHQGPTAHPAPQSRLQR